jgi:hypothetical protein
VDVKDDQVARLRLEGGARKLAGAGARKLGGCDARGEGLSGLALQQVRARHDVQRARARGDWVEVDHDCPRRKPPGKKDG